MNVKGFLLTLSLRLIMILELQLSISVVSRLFSVLTYSIMTYDTVCVAVVVQDSGTHCHYTLLHLSIKLSSTLTWNFICALLDSRVQSEGLFIDEYES